MALALLGGDCVRELGIYDFNERLCQRWEHEINQIAYPWAYDRLPAVRVLTEEELFLLQPLRHILDLLRQHILLITIQTPQPFFRLSQIGFVAHQPGRLACACPPAEKNQPLRLAGLLLCDFPDTRQRFAGN